MTENSAVDVLISGAGAAGLTLAIELARRGVSFRLIEKLNDPFRGSRGKGIQPRSQEVFEDLGILDRIVALGGAIPGSGNIVMTAASANPTLWWVASRRRPSPIIFR